MLWLKICFGISSLLGIFCLRNIIKISNRISQTKTEDDKKFLELQGKMPFLKLMNDFELNIAFLIISIIANIIIIITFIIYKNT